MHRKWEQGRLTPDGLQALITGLVSRGYQVVGPTLRDGAIIYDTLSDLADLPAGWTDQQDAGRYRLNTGRTGRYSVTRLGLTPGSAFYTRLPNACGRRAARVMGDLPSSSRRKRRRN